MTSPDRRHPSLRGTAITGARETSPVDVLALQPPEWTVDAVCASTDPAIFFPEKGESTRPAKLVCAGCEVRAECLAWALKNNERFGVYGGLSERERRRLLRRRGVA